MTFFSQMRTNRKTRIRTLIALGAAVVLVGILIAGLLALTLPAKPAAGSGQTPPPVSAEAVATNAPTSTSVPVNSITGWTLAAPDSVSPRVGAGDAPSEEVFARFAVAVANESVLAQDVAVSPDTKYVFSANVRASGGPSSAAFTFEGAEPAQLAVADVGTEWTVVTQEFTTGAEQTTLPLRLAADAAPTDLDVDGISLTVSGGPELVENGSFEAFSAPIQVTNDSLIMTTGEAYFGLSMPTEAVSWTLRDATDAVLDSGTVEPLNGITFLPFTELSQGFYTVEYADAASSAAEISTVGLAILDRVTQSEAAKPIERFGIMVHPARPFNAGSEAVAAALGFGSFRFVTSWADNETSEGVYDFAGPDEPLVRAMQANGLDALGITGFRNKAYDDYKTPSTPEGTAAYARYASALVGYYGLDAVEIHNEFNHEPFNNGACGLTGTCYLELLKPAAEQVRADHPGTKIVGPANARKDDKFLEELYQAGGLNYLDVVSFHPYEYNYTDNKGAEFLVENLQQAHERIKQYNDGADKPIWLTEMGWSSTLVESDRQQADYLVRSEVISFANGVERYFWYDLVNDHLHPLDHEGNFGLVRQKTDQVPVFSPKHSAMAQAVLTRKLGDKVFSVRDALDATTYSYAFGTKDDTTRVAWSTTPVTVSYPSKKPVTVTDQYGSVSVVKPKKGAVTLDLGEQTLYLDGALGAPSIVGK